MILFWEKDIAETEEEDPIVLKAIGDALIDFMSRNSSAITGSVSLLVPLLMRGFAHSDLTVADDFVCVIYVFWMIGDVRNDTKIRFWS